MQELAGFVVLAALLCSAVGLFCTDAVHAREAARDIVR